MIKSINKPPFNKQVRKFNASSKRGDKGKPRRRSKVYQYPEYLTNFNLPPISDYHCFDKRSKKGLIKIRKYLPFLQRWAMSLSLTFEVPFDVVNRACIQIVNLMDKRVAYKGFAPTMVFLKEIQGKVLRFSCNHHFDPIISSNTLDSDGLPRELSEVTAFAKNKGPDSQKYRQLADSILQIYRLFLPPGDKPDIGTITTPFGHDIEPQTSLQPGDFVKRVLNSFDNNPDGYMMASAFCQTVKKSFQGKHYYKRFKGISSDTKLHLCTTSGPNGPALPTALVDLVKLNETDLVYHITSLCILLKFKDLNRLIKLNQLTKASYELHTNRSASIGRIGEKVEVGGKVRLFAIVDYFTQSLFSGLHKHLFKWLRKQNEDGTFDHNKAALSAKAATVGEYRLHLKSVDLKAATDRLPVQLQTEIIYQITGSEQFAISWRHLMTMRDFNYSGKAIRYSVGQPMGALSSWAMLAVTHHMIVRSCFKLVGESWVDKYRIIGDDIYISSEKASNKYIEYMTRILLVPVSPLKGYDRNTISNSNPLFGDYSIDTCVCELAKRVFYNGFEMTGVSPNIYKDGLESPYSFKQMVKIVEGKLSSVEREHILSWATITVFSNLSFRKVDALRQLTFPSSTARIPLRGEVGEEDFEYLCKILPWITEPLRFKLYSENLKVLFVKRLRERCKDAMDNLIDFASDTSPQQVTVPVTAYWKHMKVYRRSLMKRVSNTLSDLLSGLGKIDPLDSRFFETYYENAKTLYAIYDLNSLFKGLKISHMDPIKRASREFGRLIKLAAQKPDDINSLTIVESPYELSVKPIVRSEIHDGYVFEILEDIS